MELGNADRLLRLWTEARDVDPMERPAALLAVLTDGGGLSSLAHLPLGERDRRLLSMYQAMFGPRLDAVTPCHSCGELVEVTVDVSEILAQEPGSSDLMKVHHLELGEVAVDVRLPSTADLVAATAASTVEAAREALIGRCVSDVVRDGGCARRLDDTEIDALAAELERLDPLLDLELSLTCPACGAGNEVPLDVGAFVWAEVAVRARRLLLEVDALARRYGWSEGEIIALKPARRAVYLELG